MSENPNGEQRTNSNDDRTEFDARTEGNLKRVSRELDSPIVTGGWIFEDGDKHPLPAADGEQGGGSAW